LLVSCPTLGKRRRDCHTHFRASRRSLLSNWSPLCGAGGPGQPRLQAKIPELIGASTGRFSDHRAFVARMYLDVIDQRSQAIADPTERIEVVMEPFSRLL
jgi:hypothetical protein